MVTRRIARNGMRGRKKISLLLILVLSFTFIFITTIVILETSMQQTRISQREQLYGTWHAAYLGADAAEREKFLAEPDVTEAVTSYLLGKDKNLGNVGTISPELVQMGKLVVTQGRLPEGPGEIVIEENVADSLGLTEPLGETIALNMENILVSVDKQAYISSQFSDIIGEEDLSQEVSVSSFRRQLADKERITEDLLLSINSEYAFTEETRYIKPEEIEENGLLYARNLILTRKYKITGIIQSFSGFWDTGAYPVAGMFVNQEETDYLLEAIRDCTILDLSEYAFNANIFARSDTRKENLYDGLADRYLESSGKVTGNERTVSFRRNTYAYPPADSDSSESLIFLVIVVIFIVTFCAILQIFLTQMKQRTRKIALLKSIGTTNGQVCAILFWEGIYLLCYSLPAGVLLGFLTSYGTVCFVNARFQMDLMFYIRPGMIIYGILAGCIALFAGMLIPLIKAVNVPLVGEIAVTVNKRKRSVRQSLGRKNFVSKPLTYERITRTHHRLNWRRHFLTSVITCISCMLVFTSLYLGYEAFLTYHRNVTDANRPNYELHALHGMDWRDGRTIEEELQETSPGAHVVSYRQMNQVFLKYEDMDESPLISELKELLPKERYAEFISTEPTMEEQLLAGADPKDYEEMYGSLSTTLYGVDTSDEVYDKIKDMVTEGEVSDNQFLMGESVILAIPMYRKASLAVEENKRIVPELVTEQEMFHYVLNELGGVEFTYDAGLLEYYEKDESVQPGDELTLFTRRESVSAAGGPPVYDSYQTKVAGIIYYTKDEPVYPFLTESSGITLIGSTTFMGMISPRTLYNPVKRATDYNGDEEQFTFILSQCPTSYGETHMNIYTADGANAVESAARTAWVGKNYGMSFVNFNEENWNLYYRALNNALILGILGGTSLLIALLILWNIHMSAFEQERKRIGVLQALGVTNQKIAADYWKMGVKNAGVSLVISHAILFGMIYLTQGGIFYFKHYPWTAHIAIAAAYFILMVLIQCGPVRELRKYAPTENIAS